MPATLNRAKNRPPVALLYNAQTSHFQRVPATVPGLVRRFRTIRAVPRDRSVAAFAALAISLSVPVALGAGGPASPGALRTEGAQLRTAAETARLAARAEELAAVSAQAEARAQELEQRAAARSAYLAELRARAELNERQLAAAEAAASAAQQRTQFLQPPPAAADQPAPASA